jgi:uncharacterized protein (DUF58 family)
MTRYRIIYAAALLTDLAVLTMTSTRMALIAFFVMIAAPLVSYAYITLFTRTVVLGGDVEETAGAGKETEGHLAIFIPRYIVPGVLSFTVKSENMMFSRVRKQKIVVNPDRGKQVINIPFVSDVCGVTKITMCDFECHDLMSLFKRKIHFSYEGSVTVYPERMQLETVYSKEFLMEHEGTVYDNTKRGSDTSEIMNIRDYAYGDNVRNIHWKLSSKLKRPVIREFSRPNNLNIMVFCDLSRCIGGESIASSRISNCISIMAAISGSMAERGIEHTVCLLGKGVQNTFAVSNMNDHLKMLTGAMSIELKREAFNAAEAFVDLGLCET